MALAKEHAAVTGATPGSGVPVLTYTTVGHLGSVQYRVAKIKPIGPSAV